MFVLVSKGTGGAALSSSPGKRKRAVCGASQSRVQFQLDSEDQLSKAVAALSSCGVAQSGELVASELEARTVERFVAS